MVVISFPLFLSLSISLPLLVEIALGIPGEQRTASLTTRLYTHLEVSLGSAHSQSSAESPVAGSPFTGLLTGQGHPSEWVPVLPWEELSGV